MCKLLTQGKFGFAIEHMYELFLVTECYLYTAIHYMCLLKDVKESFPLFCTGTCDICYCHGDVLNQHIVARW